jgi:dTMP kinase
MKQENKLKFLLKQNTLSRFIVCEGIDGSGKSSLIENFKKTILSNPLYNKYQDIIDFSCEPQNEGIGLYIRDIIKSDSPYKIVDGKTIALLFAADRNEHLNKYVYPSIIEEKWHLSDRYFFSTWVYQPSEQSEFVSKIFPLPEYTIWLKIPAEKAFERSNKRNTTHDIYEKLDKIKEHEKRYTEIFEEMKGKINLIELNVDRPFNDVVKDFNDIMFELLQFKFLNWTFLLDHKEVKFTQDESTKNFCYDISVSHSGH